MLLCELHRMDRRAWEKYLSPEVCLVRVNRKDWKGWGRGLRVLQINGILPVSFRELK